VRWIAGQEDIGAASDGSQSRIPLRSYLGNLEAMAEEATALGATPVFLVLPAPMDFDGAPLPPVVQEYRAAMAQVAATRGGLLVSGPEAFREADAGMAWFMDQVHPTAAGHAILASALVEVLENRLP
jgi:lysophospholipase L1-like esterase